MKTLSKRKNQIIHRALGGQIHILLQQSTLDASRQWNNAFKFLKESKPKIPYPVVLIRVLSTVRNGKPTSNGLNKEEMYYLALYEIQRQGITRAGKFISLIMINDKSFPDSSAILLCHLQLFWIFSQTDSSLVARCPQYFQVPHPETTVSRGRQECLLLRSTDILFFMFCSLKFYHMLIPQPVIGKIIGDVLTWTGSESA